MSEPPEETDRHYLVVANQTLASEQLLAEVRACLAAGPCDFHIVVPATHPRDHATWTEGNARALARGRLDAALAQFRDVGAAVEGTVGDESAMLAIGDALRGGSFDHVILATLPAGPSRWLRQDLPHRVERVYGCPVTHIVAARETLKVGT